jgi:hypothetical protein
MKCFLVWLTGIAVLGITVVACGDGSPGTSEDGGDTASDLEKGTGGDGDGDGDTDGDGDGDTDGDGDGDTDGDGDGDTDGDGDGDGDGDSDADSTADAGTDTDEDAGTGTDGDTEADTDTDSDTETNTDMNEDTETSDDADGGADTGTGAGGEDTSGQYTCPAERPDPDLNDDIEPSCADESDDHVSCPYDDRIVCVCGGALDHDDMVWQCDMCPLREPDDNDRCDLLGQECGYDDSACVCERVGPGEWAWNCGASDVDTATESETEIDTATEYTCPAEIPDDDLSDQSMPSCSDELVDHVNCSYEDDVICICGGSADKEDMVWQCVTCPRTPPSGGDTCDVLDLECSYARRTCVCEFNNGDREWRCD